MARLRAAGGARGRREAVGVVAVLDQRRARRRAVRRIQLARHRVARRVGVRRARRRRSVLRRRPRARRVGRPARVHRRRSARGWTPPRVRKDRAGRRAAAGRGDDPGARRVGGGRVGGRRSVRRRDGPDHGSGAVSAEATNPDLMIDDDHELRVPPLVSGRAVPAATPESEPFWSGLARGEIVLLRCRACARFTYLAAPGCPWCGAPEMTPEAVDGRGTLYSFTVCYTEFGPGVETP